MLRSLFVLGILAFGLRHAVRGPFYALLLYLWLAYFRPESWLWDPAIFMALNLSFLVGVFCLMLAAFSAQLSLNGRVILLILMVVQSMFSTITSPYLSAALPSAIDYAKAIMMTWMIASLATTVARLRLTIVVISLSLGFESAKQGWAQLLLNPGARNDNTLPSFGDNNLVAVGMFALVALIIALSRTATRRWERWGYRLLAVGIIYRGLSTYSRGGFICAATLGVMFILRSKRRLMPIVALATVSALLLPVLPTEFWDRIASVQNVPLTNASAPTGAAAPVGGDADTVSAASRMYFWSLAVEMANQHPLSGIGHNAFKNAFGEYDSLNGAYGRDRAVHSMWFGMLAELGYPGLFIMVWCVVLGFVAARRARRNRGSGPEALALREFGVALETSLVVICIGGAFVNFQYVELFWHTIGLTIAINTVAMHAARPAVAMASQPIAAIA